jgi:hypothetical protein
MLSTSDTRLFYITHRRRRRSLPPWSAGIGIAIPHVVTIGPSGPPPIAGTLFTSVSITMEFFRESCTQRRMEAPVCTNRDPCGESPTSTVRPAVAYAPRTKVRDAGELNQRAENERKIHQLNRRQTRTRGVGVTGLVQQSGSFEREGPCSPRGEPQSRWRAQFS